MQRAQDYFVQWMNNGSLPSDAPPGKLYCPSQEVSQTPDSSWQLWCFYEDDAGYLYYAAVILVNYETGYIRAAGEPLACGYLISVLCTEYVLSLG